MWTEIGLGDFTEGLGNIFVAKAVARANLVLIAQGLPSLVRCATLFFDIGGSRRRSGSVRIHLHGDSTGEAQMFRAAEVLQTDADAGLFNVTLANGTSSVTHVVDVWDGTTATIVSAAVPTTTATPNAGAGTTTRSDFVEDNVIVLGIVGGLLVCCCCILLVCIVRARRDAEAPSHDDSPYGLGGDKYIHYDTGNAMHALQPLDDFDMAQDALGGGPRLDNPAAYPKSYFDPEPHHYYPGNAADPGTDSRMRSLVDQARRHYYPGNDWPQQQASMHSPRPQEEWMSLSNQQYSH